MSRPLTPTAAPGPHPDEESQLRFLRTPEAVRRRCARVLEIGERGQLPSFTVDHSKIGEVADRVAQVLRASGAAVPVFGLLAHLDDAGAARRGELTAALSSLTRDDRARALVELVTLGVVLGAHPGPAWRYRDPSGSVHAGSQGLTLAIVRSFLAGGFSAEPRQPLRVDAQVLAGLTPARLAGALQVTADNPLVGLDGRLALLARLAEVSQRGALVDRLRGRAHGNAVHAASVLAEVIAACASIWPTTVALAGQNLGDVWTLTLLAPPPAHLADRLVPLHMLSQWLAYSVVEPLEAAGLQVTGLGELTGLAEVRTGGLFVDSGVLVPRDPATLVRHHEIGDELVVEWRACTVGLLERLAPLVRARLGVDEASLPVARIMLGTFRAGRALAAERRPGGAAPITIVSDGAVL